jgi:hypothetical protein
LKYTNPHAIPSAIALKIPTTKEIGNGRRDTGPYYDGAPNAMSIRQAWGKIDRSFSGMVARVYTGRIEWLYEMRMVSTETKGPDRQERSR